MHPSLFYRGRHRPREWPHLHFDFAHHFRYAHLLLFPASPGNTTEITMRLEEFLYHPPPRPADILLNSPTSAAAALEKHPRHMVTTYERPPPGPRARRANRRGWTSSNSPPTASWPPPPRKNRPSTPCQKVELDRGIRDASITTRPMPTPAACAREKSAAIATISLAPRQRSSTRKLRKAYSRRPPPGGFYESPRAGFAGLIFALRAEGGING